MEKVLLERMTQFVLNFVADLFRGERLPFSEGGYDLSGRLIYGIPVGRVVKGKDPYLQDVMKSLVWRYVTSEQSKHEQAPVTEDDVNELKQQITSFRYDLLDVLKDNGMKVTKIQRKRGEGALATHFPRCSLVNFNSCQREGHCSRVIDR